MTRPIPIVAWAALFAAVVGGCEPDKIDLAPPWANPSDTQPEPAAQPVPKPLHLLLPQAVRIHSFTGMRTFNEAGGVQGIDVRIEALDAYGDSTKAFGTFRFALYPYRPNLPNKRGQRIATWEEDLLEPRKNALHWDRITQAYQFRLQWNRPVPVGNRYLLTATFTSPFSLRKFAEREFVAGE